MMYVWMDRWMDAKVEEVDKKRKQAMKWEGKVYID
jgi:hypothetical protein